MLSEEGAEASIPCNGGGKRGSELLPVVVIWVLAAEAQCFTWQSCGMSHNGI